LAEPSKHQLERFIRECAADSQSIAITTHAFNRMRQRKVTNAMLMETLRMGCIRQQPEPDMKFTGLKCRMERLVSGILVGAVVYIEYPTPELTIVTVIDLGE
jgi:hypothetical protein